MRSVKKTSRIPYRQKKAVFRSKAARSNTVAVRRKSLRSVVKDVVLKTSETKQRIIGNTIVGLASNILDPEDPLNKFLHNCNTVHPLWEDGSTTGLWPTGGTSDSGRIGDNINAVGIGIRCVMQIPHDRRNVRVKVYFVQWNSAQESPRTRAIFYHWTMQNAHMDSVNKDNFGGVKYLGTFSCRSVDQTTGSQDKTIMFKRWIPLKKRLTFRGTIGNPTNLKENGALIFVPYDTVTTSQTDVLITRVQCASTLYYKDI